MRFVKRRLDGVVGVLFVLALLGGVAAWAATKSVDLDKNGTAESAVALNILSTFPAKVENVVTNKAVGYSFTFSYKNAGPGGWNGSVGAGTTTGVGTKWTWQTSQTIYSFTGNSCTNDICFTQTAGPTSVGTRGPFSVPGRSLSSSGVTLSNTSLTSSLVTFFSPPQTLFSATASVGQAGSGQVNYITSLLNTGPVDLTANVQAGPPGCCPRENQLNCDGTCVDYLSDPANCGDCGVRCDTLNGEFCDQGSCRTMCPAGLTLCGTECVDVTSDPLNCGGCGQACGTNQICTDSACFTCKSPDQTACSNQCVNIHTDPLNCGACGVDCNALCPSTGQGTCSQGNSCFCVDAGSAAAAMEPSASTASLTAPSPSATLRAPAEVCLTEEATETLPPGTSQVLNCSSAGYLAREVLSIVSVCAGGGSADASGLCPDGTTASQGPFIQLVPDPGRPIGALAVSLSPVGVSVLEPGGDGLWQPGETAQLRFSIANAGFATVTGACATLLSLPQDITDDGVDNPTTVDITGSTACFPDIPAAPPAGADCSAPAASTPVLSLTPFTASIPAGYLGDTSRIFILRVTGTANGAEVSEDVPVTLGIAGVCDSENIQGNYDGLVGLDSPLARLVPDDDPRPLPFPAKAFSIGKTRPLKLSVTCGGLFLDDTQTIAPQITELFNLTANAPVDITKININDSPNPYDPFFRSSSSFHSWIFNMRTKELTAGKYRLTILIDGRKPYVTGLEFN